jgi:hypothetical protein
MRECKPRGIGLRDDVIGDGRVAEARCGRRRMNRSLHCLAMAVLQQTAEALTALDLTVALTNFYIRLDDLVAKALAIRCYCVRNPWRVRRAEKPPLVRTGVLTPTGFPRNGLAAIRWLAGPSS